MRERKKTAGPRQRLPLSEEKRNAIKYSGREQNEEEIAATARRRNAYPEREERGSSGRPPRKPVGERGRERDRGSERGAGKPFGEKKSFGERPRREDGDKPFRKPYPGREEEERGRGREESGRNPRKSFGEKKSFGERPRRDDGDRPFKKTFEERGRKDREQDKGRERGRSRENERGAGKPYGERPRRDDGEKPFRKTFGERKRRDDGDKPYKRVPADREKKSSPRRTSGKDGGEEIRLNKYISNAGICSRREADVLIQSGVITVNGQVVTEMGYKVSRTDKVKYGDQMLNTEKLRYVLLNKPKGFITTMEDPEERKTVMALVENACRERIYPVGRLDRNTTGLLLFTNDGEMAKKLTHPRYGIRKIYHVVLEKNITKADMKKIADGLELEDGPVQVDAIEYIDGTKDKKEVGIELHSGQNRVVRRLFETLGHKVEKLDRVAYAGLTKKNLPRGEWRFLTEMEINMLKMIH